MNQNELIFSNDCVINFDDLGEFKDFTEDIEKMLQNLTEIKNNQTTIFKHQLLRQILKADPEDTFHAPAFKNLIQVVLQILVERKQFFETKPEIYKLVFANLMEILEDSLVSYQFSEDIGPKICAYVIDEGKRKGFSAFEKHVVLLCLAKLSKKLSYIDELEKYVELLYHCIDEQRIIIEQEGSDEWKRMMLNVYCEVVELSTRNRRVRELLGIKVKTQSMLTLDHLFLGYKISLWQRNKEKTKLYLKRLETQKLTNYQVFKLAVKKLS